MLRVHLDVLRTGGEGVRRTEVRQGRPHRVLDEPVFDLDPRGVRGRGIGRPEPQRLVDRGIQAFVAQARGVGARATDELGWDEIARARVARDSSE